MERKARVTQEIVNNVCSELLESGKNITVNAVIGVCGGSFSTVGQMVKNWKEQLATQSKPIIEMPEMVSQAMQRATADIWTAASTLASENVERIQKEATEAITKAKNELSEYAGEVSRLEIKLEGLNVQLNLSGQNLATATNKTAELITQNTALETRLTDRDNELKRSQANYEKLQAELIIIAKSRNTEQKTQKKTKK